MRKGGTGKTSIAAHIKRAQPSVPESGAPTEPLTRQMDHEDKYVEPIKA